MINQNAIDITWIEKVSKANRNADKILVEKTIRAFLLLEGLVTAGMSFVFKGGTNSVTNYDELENIIQNKTLELVKVFPHTCSNYQEALFSDNMQKIRCF